MKAHRPGARRRPTFKSSSRSPQSEFVLTPTNGTDEKGVGRDARALGYADLFDGTIGEAWQRRLGVEPTTTRVAVLERLD
jgi:hypothetical protein